MRKKSRRVPFRGVSSGIVDARHSAGHSQGTPNSSHTGHSRFPTKAFLITKLSGRAAPPATTAEEDPFPGAALPSSAGENT
eukprot:CAMPEP_0184717926 /NCGR_PEP_ID=MMETSP0314-20130426/7251_1 /TAXON_ID=38298 /ORGANISM="Rhodella maculata, Strain CCMP 736" /LENGTH=80 /DNA_ID=CAMNT_0027181573 /DNA_START=19 /DNA_END=261 /DNA_ORIENTATION=-